MKWLIRIVAAIALAVVIGVYLASLDVNQYKGEIIDLVEAALAEYGLDLVPEKFRRRRECLRMR